MSSGKVKSMLITGVVASVIIGGLSLGIYKLSATDLFDSTGGYVKTKVESDGVAAFMQKCNTFKYEDVSESPDKYINSNLKFWATIVDIEKISNGDIEYLVKFNGTDTAVKLIKVKALNKESFFKGDKVYVFGTLTKMVQTKDSKIPYIEARRLLANE